MKKPSHAIVLLCLLLLFSVTCSKDEPMTICSSPCASSAPWRVESLDLGLPCFATQEACIQWANTHGYGGKPCVKCD